MVFNFPRPFCRGTYLERLLGTFSIVRNGQEAFRPKQKDIEKKFILKNGVNIPLNIPKQALSICTQRNYFIKLLKRN